MNLMSHMINCYSLCFYFYFFFAALELSHAITVKPTNKQPITENSHVDAKKNPQSKDHEDRVARYVPYITSRHHLDSNVNLVRVS